MDRRPRGAGPSLLPQAELPEPAPGSPRPFRPSAIDFDVSFLSYPVEKTGVLGNAYVNSLSNCDLQLERLVAALREIGQLDRTILVVYVENGEAFHENGFVTHAQHPSSRPCA